jgi:Tfp pilus assembly protein FimT
MVVIGIIAIMAAIAVPMSIHSIAARRLGASTLDVLAFIEHSRAAAIKRGEPVYVRLDVAQATYRATVGSVSGDLVRSGKTGPGVTLRQPAADALPTTFRFNSHGMAEKEVSTNIWALTSGKLELSNGRPPNKVVSLNAGGHAKIERAN